MKGQLKFFAAVLLMMLAILLLNTTVLADDGTPTPEGYHQGILTTASRNTGTYAVGWGSLMLINAGLAQGKNRKGLNWFLISLFLGPIATFLLVAFFPKLPATTP